MKITAFLEKISTDLWSLIGLALLGVIGLLDYLTGHELAFSIFYLIPIALIAWFANGRLGILISVAGAGVWLLADIEDKVPYSSPFIYIWNTLIRLSFFLLTVRLLRLGQALEREKALARTDYLTGVANIRFFQALAQREIARSARSRLPLTIVYLDVDNFKAMNDTFGHLIGDKVLRVVAEGMKQHLRQTDIVARVGGDEFVILLPEVGSEDAQVVLTKTHSKLLEEMQNQRWPVTFSIGVLTFTETPHSPEEMLKLADQVMYTVKKNGKNHICYLAYPGFKKTKEIIDD